MGIPEIMKQMEYGPARVDPAPARDWLDRHGAQFGHFVAGAFTRPGAETLAIRDPASNVQLATVARGTAAEVAAAVEAAARAQKEWAARDGHDRARHLAALARHVERNADLLSLLGALESGTPLRELRRLDLPLMVRQFDHHAGRAAVLDEDFPGLGPWGVCAELLPADASMTVLARTVAPALAAGNAVVLKPAPRAPLTTLAFAELCAEAGLPAGLVNVVAGDAETGAALAASGGVNRIGLAGSREAGRDVRRRTAGTGMGLALELGGPLRVIVCEDADLDAALEGVAEAAWLSQGRIGRAGVRVLVAEGVEDRVVARLTARMERVIVGDPLDRNTDMGAVIDTARRDRIRDQVARARAEGATIAEGRAPEGWFHPPVLAPATAPASLLWAEGPRAPVVTVTSFRTPDEAIALANNTCDGLAAAIWSENLNLSLDLAGRMAAGVVWLNCTDALDAGVEFGGCRDSGWGRAGGDTGMRAYLRAPVVAGTHAAGDRPQTADGRGIADLPAAIEAAAASAGWSLRSGSSRADILRRVAGQMSDRRVELIAGLAEAGAPPVEAEAELETAIRRVAWYAARADRIAGRAVSTEIGAQALVMPEPLGVVGLVCPAERPLLGFVSLALPALAAGNRVVAVPSGAAPTPALELCRLFGTAGMPGGTVKVVPGPRDTLARTLARHDRVDAIWYVGPAGAMIETESAGNLKPTWIEAEGARDWMGADGQGRGFLERGTRTKAIWLPRGA